MNKKLHGNETVTLNMSESGHFNPVTSSSINRGFLFGDGLFETMIFSDGKIRYKESHLSRLKKGCKALQLEFYPDEILDIFETYIKDEYFAQNSLRVRWNVYRDGIGKYTPETNKANHHFTIQNHTYIPPAIKNAYICHTIKVPSLPWSNCKTLNALVYVMANLERQKKQYDELILLNSNGIICEAGASNLFWVKDSVYYTPSLSANCIAGIGRKAIIKELKNQNIEIIKGLFTPKEFLSADQIFTSNITGIHYLSQIDMREFDTTPLPFLEKLFMI